MFCIVGASLAGDTAAATLRAEGYAGRILLIGDEDVPPYDRPPLSKEMLYDNIPAERIYLRAESWYEEQGIELRLGKVVERIEPEAQRLILAGGEAIDYEKLLLTTGARARPLPRAEGASVPVLLVRTLADAERLNALLKPGVRVGVIGAGVIGLEVTASAIRRGCSVDVVDIADRVMTRVLPPFFSDYMARLHRSQGVRLHLSAQNIDIRGNAIVTSTGPIEADLIIVGIGIVPNIELARAAGIACDDGILVDAHCRTSASNIFAAGDVARYPCPFEGRDVRCENWHHAQDHGAAAARNMIGPAEPYRAVPNMWSDQYDVKLQTCGRIEGEPVMRGDAEGAKFMFLYRDEGERLIGAVGVNQAKDMRFAQRLIERGAIIEPHLLADPKQDLRKLAV